MKKILVTGAKGQLGSELQVLSKNYTQYQFVFTDVDELDITNLDTLKDFFLTNSIDYIFNCAAYTAVDKAEEEKDLANVLNHQAVEYLLLASEKQQSKFIQISTDYVFGGVHNLPLHEDLPTNPESVYGLSKLKGEQVALESKRAIVVRTSWLYSSIGHNFVKTIRKYGQERKELTVVFDQIGTPTYARDLAKALLDILDYSEQNNSFEKGIYHFANEGVLSWYDFAKEICELSNINIDILPVLSNKFPTPAKRPAYSVLDKNKIKQTFGLKIPYWKESLKECVEILDQE